MKKNINENFLGDFVHLHVHSDYSILDSSLKIPELIKRAKDCGMSAVALTDHGNIMGGIKFYKEAIKNGIKPIIGSELYVAEHSRFSKPDRIKGEINYFHLIVLVKNKQGYRNLCELITKSNLEGFYRKPRVDKEILEKYKDGLIILSSCVLGEISFNLLNNREERAYESAKWYKEVFKDDYYLEIQNHGLYQQIEVIPKIQQLSSDLSIPLVATNNVHYLDKEDSDVREILICLQTGNVLSDQDRPLKKQTNEMYLKSTEEMSELFSDIPESISTTLDIAAKCNFDFKFGELSLFIFSVPNEFTIDRYFEKICRNGFEKIKESLLDKTHSIEVYEERLDYEINQIKEMGFAEYFLIIWNIVEFSKNNNITVGPGRGTVTGSLASYVMGITKIDPLEYDLLFERFINPENPVIPDIVFDFETERRVEVFDYIRDKYGKKNTAQIITFGKMKGKTVIREIGRVLGISKKEVKNIIKIIPDGQRVTIKNEIKTNLKLKDLMNKNPESKKLVEFATKLENNIKHTSMHAAAISIAPEKITEFIPLCKIHDDIVTQFDKDEIEELGLIKIDILGLKTLTIIKNILSRILKIEEKEIDLYDIPMDDKKTYEVFQKADTDGIFQFESSGMRDLLKVLKPKKFEDLIAINALYRPGPLNSGMTNAYIERKIGKEKVVYELPELEPILRNTSGLIVFQEQIMQIFNVIADISLSRAGKMIRVLANRKGYIFYEIEKYFIQESLKKGFDIEKINKIYSQMKEAAPYGFNRSHSTAYTLISYQTAYLKANYTNIYNSMLKL